MKVFFLTPPKARTRRTIPSGWILFEHGRYIYIYLKPIMGDDI